MLFRSLGDTSAAGPVTQAFDRGTPLPRDRRQLLVPAVATGPAAAPSDDDTVCTCNGVTAGTLRRCAERGMRTVEQVAETTRATTGCGTCASSVRALLEQAAPAAATV